MSTKTYTLTEDAEGHKIRKCSEYVITDEAGKVKAVSLLALDGQTPIPLNKNFSAPTSPIVAQSYATLIANASNVTDKAITISTESAKMLAEYCKYRGQQTRNLAFGGSYSGSVSGLTIAYDNGVFTFSGTTTEDIARTNTIFKNGAISLKAGSYVISGEGQAGNYSLSLHYLSSGGTVAYITTSGASFTLSADTNVYVGMLVKGDKTIPSTTISVQIEQGTTATDFVPPLTTATTIADANAKGFKVCTLNNTSYDLSTFTKQTISGVSFEYKEYDNERIIGKIRVVAPSGYKVMARAEGTGGNQWGTYAEGEQYFSPKFAVKRLSLYCQKTDGTIGYYYANEIGVIVNIADTYELTPSRTYDDVFYPSQNDSGDWLTPAKLTNEGLLNLTTLVFTPKE